MDDTAQAARELQTSILRKLSAADRLAIAFEMSSCLRELALTRLRLEHPSWSESDLRRELLRYTFLPDPLPAGLR